MAVAGRFGPLGKVEERACGERSVLVAEWPTRPGWLAEAPVDIRGEAPASIAL